jgi:dipeptidyl aminopeptidase/acylaminoacyl peptidase
MNSSSVRFFLVLGALAIIVFGFIVLLNRVDGSTIFSRAQKNPSATNTPGGIADLPKNELLAPLEKAGSEIAVIVDGSVRIVLPDPKAPQPVIAVIDAEQPQTLAWAKDRLYWVEKRAVKKSSSSASETSYVIVEASFDDRAVKKQDVYRSERLIESLEADPSGQLVSFIEGESVDERELFVYAKKTNEVRRIAQDPVSVAWSPAAGRFALVVASNQTPRPKTQYLELSASAEKKSTVDLPENFGGFGVIFLNDSTVAGLDWSLGGTAKLQTVDLRSNAVTEVGEVKENSDARLSKRGKIVYPVMHTVQDENAVLITIADRVNSIYAIQNGEQTYLRIDEEPIGLIDSTTVLVKRGFDLFSVGLKSGIQTAVASDVTAAALR